MEKEILIGYIGKHAVNVEIRIENEKNLRITGTVGRHSAGQIRDELLKIDTLANGWNVAKVVKLLEIWKEWHLNDMIAGSPRQREWIKANDGFSLPYREMIEVMPDDILNDVEYLHNGKPYRYGSAWLRKEVPHDVMEWLKDL